MKILITIPVVLLSLTNLKGQIIKTKLDIPAGISAREFIHGGLRYQYTEITQIGFYIGGDLEIKEENITTWCFDHMIHFGNISYTSNRPVWYARQGFTYSKNSLARTTRKYSYINFSLGRDFPINDWFGINADLGLIWQIREYKEEDPPLETPIHNQWYTYPLVRIQAYFSF